MKLSLWFKGIRGRLLAVALLPILGFSIASYVAFNGISKVSDFLISAHKDIIPGTQALNGLVVARNKYGYHVWAAIALHENTKVKMERLALARSAYEDWIRIFEKFDGYPHHSAEVENLNFIRNNKDKYLALLDKTLRLVEEGSPLSIKEAQDLLLGDIWKLGSEIAKNNGEIVNIYEKRATTEGRESEETKAGVYRWTAIINACTSLVILVIVIFISSRIATVISSIASNLSEASGNVTNSVQQLNEAGTSLSQASTEAAASLEETVASLEELTSMVQVNSGSAREAASLSVTSCDAAERGEREIRGLIESMGHIAQSSRKIEEIISVIDDLAFQTNLLALNAAVEAARAGEQGKGFAVVAEAVRALAQKSAGAAKDISGLIKISVTQVENGSRIADKSGEVLSEIVSSIKKVADLNNEIAAASSEQTSGIQQISKAMNQLDQVAQANAASAEEISATSGEINDLAKATQKLTVDLNLAVLGESKMDGVELETMAEAV